MDENLVERLGNRHASRLPYELSKPIWLSMDDHISLYPSSASSLIRSSLLPLDFYHKTLSNLYLSSNTTTLLLPFYFIL